MTIIDTKNAPGAIGPYSQGFVVGDLVITCLLYTSPSPRDRG